MRCVNAESRLFSIEKKTGPTATQKRFFKGFYGGPVGFENQYWLSKAQPTALPPAQEILPGLSYGQTMALFDWKEGRTEGEDQTANDEDNGDISIEEEHEQEKTNVKAEDMWLDPNTKIFFGRAAWTPKQLESELKEGRQTSSVGVLRFVALMHSPSVGVWFVARPEGLGAILPEPPLFSATTMPPAKLVDPDDRAKQSRLWGDVLKDMGGSFAPLAKFASLPRRYTPSCDEEEDEATE